MNLRMTMSPGVLSSPGNPAETSHLSDILGQREASWSFQFGLFPCFGGGETKEKQMNCVATACLAFQP